MPATFLVFLLLFPFMAYLVGSLSFAVIVSQALGLRDPRSYGSGNPGATNVLRSGNKLAAALTLLFDMLKGAVPGLVARYGLSHTELIDSHLPMILGLAAFLGHLWPVFFRFQGGKGVATASGVLLAFNPLLGLLTLVTWGLVVGVSRYVSLASIVAAITAPVYQILFWQAGVDAWLMVIMSALLIWRHKSNLQKLWAGQERKLGSKTTGENL